ncbi:CLAVATA3/ESR (CLE) AMILY MEMBER MTCLE20 [Salix purpurea]|uniref:CLAVATA3/ESR (CLE) AMILY MEMBER MTCLE20 n=2 Tax=Salix TaxID=40685 RepID=A0A9Q0NZV9_SALPP|nr:CLAVATA3/ESR (CLE) AMILY MEMBER MTCLE20 [Salix purpurea]
MHLQPSLQVFVLQKLVVLTLLVLLLSGDQKEDTMVNVQDLQDQRRPSSAEKQQQKSFDMFFSSKRKVPNASDPLHNR